MAESTTASTSTSTTTARIVWDTADKFLRNIVDEEDYGDFILPFTVLRRLECMLADSKEQVTDFVASRGALPPHLIDIAVKDRFKLSFYNVSPLDLATIASVDDNVEKSLKSYIAGFSNNIADIWVSFDFVRRVQVLAEANRLHSVVKHFSTLDLAPSNVENTTMGDVFEDIMYRAFNKKGKAAGNFYTPRDAIKLMVDILITNDDDTLAGESAARSVYDPTAGSGGMLLIAHHALKRMNDKIDVTLYGQELMPSAFALGKADLLIQGGRPDAIKQGNTLVEDLYEGQTYDYVLSNPPFGMDWSADERSIRDQAKALGTRFSHGLPSTSDGQMLFLAHCASKLSPAAKNGQGGRAAVVSNASPLFTSDKGPNAIRQWLLESDLIDAIIALPMSMFYGTGIATYVWILDTKKDPERQGKIQLIDGSGQWASMRKGMGDKRREMRKGNRTVVLEAYKAFEHADPVISRVMRPEDFMFRDVPVFKQARLATRFSETSVELLRKHRDFADGYIPVLKSLDRTPWNELPKSFPQAAKAAGLKSSISLIGAVMSALAVPAADAPLAVDRKGMPVIADDWKMTERVPLSEDVVEHMERDVLPFAPDAQWDVSKAKHGNEIPFTRIFYTPEEPRLLAEIDSDVQKIMGELAAMFEAVSEE
ncbi:MULTISPECIES: class I SAM-dependent DNA methyltransferase [unclassified Rhodococcus (in: high G+C Gram-positive bacteria)]|uniref:type I restriction-modification system subunit M n=1 Tax=unclassified Rhodococcus (in: high G+C Gram-positive bacteria) TaxID=192944 RepID=UPI000B9BD89E|nr:MULTISPECIES: class I SAM-dependent DNA methyltransferase [unclassified Rhodococcus (in: high G+C Gram-positive bacteria)]OZD55900.1 restriction endonuclease [Rhodococcus sp. 06-1474-1B]OZE37243.1 restriction endonuclease [Rhodococcus sp. 05-2254-4]OZE45095.1 restriction endonuclease [Rhodococcus sp. 05-2254-3]OZE45369.1 restriction endonuclease [Rhodococcus sp. 05-2254-2]OZF42380.1 restriction endonuclease [Rhodococcus sp. 14-1411-2a]